jgi:molecular chaperone GrpE
MSKTDRAAIAGTETLPTDPGKGTEENGSTQEVPTGRVDVSDLDLTLEQELEQIREQLQEQQRITAEAQENFLRARADIENYRKRARQEMDEVRRYGLGDLVANLLPVLDDLERAQEAAQSSQNAEALREGVALIYSKLQDVLGKAGVEPIEAVGQPFDARYHEAIMQVEAGKGHEPNMVVEELRRGYRIHDRVLRASLVKVSS